MKKLLFAFVLLSVLCLSCKKDSPIPPPPVPEAVPPVTPPATPPPTPEVPDGQSGTSTSVSVDENGIKVDAQKTKVKIDGSGTSIEVKK